MNFDGNEGLPTMKREASWLNSGKLESWLQIQTDPEGRAGVLAGRCCKQNQDSAKETWTHNQKRHMREEEKARNPSL